MKQTRRMWLSDGEEILRICLFVSTKYINLMDGRTDGQTDRDRMTAYHRAAKMNDVYETYTRMGTADACTATFRCSRHDKLDEVD